MAVVLFASVLVGTMTAVVPLLKDVWPWGVQSSPVASRGLVRLAPQVLLQVAAVMGVIVIMGPALVMGQAVLGPAVLARVVVGVAQPLHQPQLLGVQIVGFLRTVLVNMGTREVCLVVVQEPVFQLEQRF